MPLLASLSHVLRNALQSWPASRAGAVMPIAAAALPAVLLVSGATLEFSLRSRFESQLQVAADAAALAVVRELGISSTDDLARLTAVAKAVAESQLSVSAEEANLQVSAVPGGNRSAVTVTITGSPKTSVGLFGEKTVAASATAKRVGAGKLCVLTLSYQDERIPKALNLEDRSVLSAPDCGVFSNSESARGVAVDHGAVVQAALICSAGGFDVHGRHSSVGYHGERRSDCPLVEDPLKDRPAPRPGRCAHTDERGRPAKLVITASRDLPAGTYCRGIEITGRDTVVTLKPRGGEDVLIVKDGPLRVTGSAALVGRGVGIAFHGDDARFEFAGDSRVELHAPTSGPLAGILIFGDRNGKDWLEHRITSDYARTLVGTIYLPRGTFTVDARNPVADLSAYTALVVNRLNLRDRPRLTLNTNYHQTQVPVPKGIADFGGNIHLAR